MTDQLNFQCVQVPTIKPYVGPRRGYPKPVQPYRQPIFLPSEEPAPFIPEPAQPTPPYSAASRAQQQDIVAAHQIYRDSVKPPASNMKPMTWSDDLAASAQNWADQCKWSHSKTPGVGENLYASSKRTPNPATYDYGEAIDSWGAEGHNYDYNTNTCAPGKTCGHYTQMVWANSDQVGCASQDCGNIEDLNWPNGGTLTVCQYSPPGNYVGQKPYQTR